MAALFVARRSRLTVGSMGANRGVRREAVSQQATDAWMMIVVAVAVSSALPASNVAELALVAPVIVLCGTPVTFTFAIQLTDVDQVKITIRGIAACRPRRTTY